MYTTHYLLTLTEIRALCTEDDLCTRCNRDEYVDVLERGGELSLDDVITLARKIAEYSDVETIAGYWGVDEEEVPDIIAARLINRARIIIVKLF